MTDIIIPPAALEAGAREITFALMHAVDEDHALPLTDDERAELARAAFLAMLEAWPGMQHDNYVIVLPQEVIHD